jgi:hypothetical protein
VCMFSLFVFNYYIWPICCKFYVCVYRLIAQLCDVSFMHWLGHVCVCVCVFVFVPFVVSVPGAWHIE